jgi:hypothetical protein
VGQPNTSSTDPIGSEPKLESLPSSSPPLGVAASPEIGGSLSSRKVSLRFLVNFRDEEAIVDEQRREKEEKEKKKEEEGLGFVLSECGLWFWKNK